MPGLTLLTSLVFDPSRKQFRNNISIDVSTDTGLITKVTARDDDAETSSTNCTGNDILDLRGKCVTPGFVDAHTHIFLHSYE